jgi:hypothetical protein
LGGQVHISNTCFYNNSFKRYAIIEVYNNGTFSSEGNYADEQTLNGLQCAIAYSVTIPESLSNITCTDFEEDSCILDTSSSNPSTTGTNGSTTADRTSAGQAEIATPMLLTALSILITFMNI